MPRSEPQHDRGTHRDPFAELTGGFPTAVYADTTKAKLLNFYGFGI